VLEPVPVPRDADHLLVSGAQMAQLEQQLFASGLPVEALMEKAALLVARHLLDHEPLQAGVLVLVGPGHNGGDALVVARELHLAGVAVRIWSPFERHKPLTAAHLGHGRWLGIPLLQEAPDPADVALWIDGLFGIGQRQGPGDAIEYLLLARQQERPHHLLAVDVPTGLCADRGICLGAGAAVAHCTTTIGLVKTGLVQDPALAYVGQLVRLDLGLPPGLLAGLPANQPLALGPKDLQAAASKPAASKYQRGRLLVIAGSSTYQGAAALALAGASSSGCGSLRAALPAPMGQSLWQQMPHVVVNQELGCSPAGDLLLEGLTGPTLERLDAVLIGPGIGASSGASCNAGSGPGGLEDWQPLQAFEGLLVIDADGLNRLSQMDGGGLAWLQQRRGATWLTPHSGEFARLFPQWAALPPLEAAQQAAQASGASVLLKGARSIVAAADGRRWQLLKANPRAARAGLGDVLAGYAAGRGASAGGDGQILAAAALDHALAGCQLNQPSPPEVAAILAAGTAGPVSN
jgi:ADP-dependent NAD(P)H-hydrate dehydratase / NAD(P)H-hydrate epimerase